MRFHIWAACAAVCVNGFSSIAKAQSQQIVVPAYYGIADCTNKAPGSSGCGVPSLGNDWTRILNAGTTVKAIVADESFAQNTNGSAPDTNFITAAAAQFKKSQGAGQHVLGYVYTNSGRRSQECVLHGYSSTSSCASGDLRASVDRWYKLYCPNSASCTIDGIFFDVGPDITVPTECQQKGYYGLLNDACSLPGGGLYQNVKSRPFATGKACGAGPCVMVNASQFPNDWVKQVADYLILWERPRDGTTNCPTPDSPPGQQYLVSTSFIPSAAQQSPNGWYFTTSTASIAAHVIFNVDQSYLGQVVATNIASYGRPGMIYVHDEPCNNTQGAVYSRLPSYFEQLVSMLSPTLDIVIPVKNAAGVTTYVSLSF